MYIHAHTIYLFEKFSPGFWEVAPLRTPIIQSVFGHFPRYEDMLTRCSKKVPIELQILSDYGRTHSILSWRGKDWPQESEI
jgi:hypothetical protein